MMKLAKMLFGPSFFSDRWFDFIVHCDANRQILVSQKGVSMDTEMLDQKMGKDKLKAMELAEDSREHDWTQPSFVAELFKGHVRWDLILPFPEQSAEDKKIGNAFLTKLE